MIRYALMKLKITKLTKKDFEVQSYSEMEFKKNNARKILCDFDRN